MQQLSPQEWYGQALAQGFVDDLAQQQAVLCLQDRFLALFTGQYTGAGLYLWGPVGRGKTWLMDEFYANLPVAGRRQHFHHFMRELHQRLHQMTGTAEPLDKIADALAAEIQVLCFDEFFINDIADAMLLGPLMQALFNRGLAVFMTSNQPPDELYQDGFNRERVLPAIAAIKNNMRVVAVDGSQDHRLHGLNTKGDTPKYLYSSRQSDGLSPLFVKLTNSATQYHDPVVLNGRILKENSYTDDILWCDFAQLCEQPFAAQDYIELCQRFRILLLDSVPELSGAQQTAKIARGTEDAASQVLAGDRILPALASRDNAVGG